MRNITQLQLSENVDWSIGQFQLLIGQLVNSNCKVIYQFPLPCSLKVDLGCKTVIFGFKKWKLHQQRKLIRIGYMCNFQNTLTNEVTFSDCVLTIKMECKSSVNLFSTNNILIEPTNTPIHHRKLHMK